MIRVLVKKFMWLVLIVNSGMCEGVVWWNAVKIVLFFFNMMVNFIFFVKLEGISWFIGVWYIGCFRLGEFKIFCVLIVIWIL